MAGMPEWRAGPEAVRYSSPVELFPWDGSALGDKPREALTEDDMALLDELAALTWPEVNLPAVRKRYEDNTELHGVKMLLKHRGLDPAM